MTEVIAALTWEPQVKGALYVVISVLVLCGSCYMILATDVGARLGFLLAGAGLFGWLATMGFIWWGYAQGPVGPDPSWKGQGIVVGDLEASQRAVLRDFPRGWNRLELEDPELADATPTVDGILAPAEGGDGPFRSANEYVLVGAFQKGGETYGPLGLNFRPFNVFHKPNYLVVQAQRSVEEPNEAGGPPRAVPDPSAEPTSVVLLRDLGAKRLNPAIFAIASTIIFGLFCYQLHVRDKEAWARKEAESQEGSGRTLEPVGR
ncbi:MAG: hypothetical protein ACLGI2_02895 [Acidimicrobiia bacterium]